LLCELSDFTKEQQNFISRKLSEYMTNRKNTLMTSKNETEKILESLEKDDNERTQLKNYYGNLLNNQRDIQNEITEIKQILKKYSKLEKSYNSDIKKIYKIVNQLLLKDLVEKHQNLLNDIKNDNY